MQVTMWRSPTLYDEFFQRRNCRLPGFLVFVKPAPRWEAFGTRLYTVSSVVANMGKGTIQSPEEMRKHFVNDLRDRLKLSDDQVMKLNLILDEARGRFHETHDKMRPELEAIRQNQIDSISGHAIARAAYRLREPD